MTWQALSIPCPSWCRLQPLPPCKQLEPMQTDFSLTLKLTQN